MSNNKVSYFSSLEQACLYVKIPFVKEIYQLILEVEESPICCGCWKLRLTVLVGVRAAKPGSRKFRE